VDDDDRCCARPHLRDAWAHLQRRRQDRRAAARGAAARATCDTVDRRRRACVSLIKTSRAERASERASGAA